MTEHNDDFVKELLEEWKEINAGLLTGKYSPLYADELLRALLTEHRAHIIDECLKAIPKKAPNQIYLDSREAISFNICRQQIIGNLNNLKP
mgnify:CR=1 FL=1